MRYINPRLTLTSVKKNRCMERRRKCEATSNWFSEVNNTQKLFSNLSDSLKVWITRLHFVKRIPPQHCSLGRKHMAVFCVESFLLIYCILVRVSHFTFHVSWLLDCLLAWLTFPNLFNCSGCCSLPVPQISRKSNVLVDYLLSGV